MPSPREKRKELKLHLTHLQRGGRCGRDVRAPSKKKKRTGLILGSADDRLCPKSDSLVLAWPPAVRKRFALPCSLERIRGCAPTKLGAAQTRMAYRRKVEGLLHIRRHRRRRLGKPRGDLSPGFLSRAKALTGQRTPKLAKELPQVVLSWCPRLRCLPHARSVWP